MDADNTEAPPRDDQCTESIVDDMTLSSHNTLEPSTEEPASLAPSANRRRPQNRWSRAEHERLRGMKDASCSWDEIGEVFPGRSLSSIQNHWAWYKVSRTISRTQYIDLQITGQARAAQLQIKETRAGSSWPLSEIMDIGRRTAIEGHENCWV